MAHLRAHDLENAAEIGLHEDADGISAQRSGEDAGGGADAALEAEAYGACSRPGRTLSTGPS